MSATGSGRWNPSTLVSSFPDCANDSVNHGSFNCWYLTTGYAPIVNVSSGGHVVAIDSSGCGWLYNDNGTWIQQRAWGCGLSKVEYGGDGNIYALSSAMCDTTHHWIAKWNGSAWINTNGCGPDFSLDPTGGNMSVAIGTTGALWVSTDYWNTGSELSGCQPGGALSVAVVSSVSKQFMVICSADNSVWLGTWTGGTNSTYTRLANGFGYMVASGSQGNNYVIGMDRHVYHLNNAGTGWDDLNGSPFTYISAGDPMNIWGVGPTSGGHNDYRFAENSIQFSRTYSGSVTCAVPPPYGQQICAQFNHTAQAQISFGRGATGAVAHATPWNGPGSWGVTATVVAHPQDLFTCLINADPADCDAWENSGNMQCSGGGSNQDQSPPQSIPYSELTEFVGTYDITAGQFLMTLEPDTNNYDGHSVTESSPWLGSNQCWWNGSGMKQYPTVKGSTWVVANGNAGHDQYGFDTVGYGSGVVVSVIQQQGAAHGVEFPCNIYIYQAMNYDGIDPYAFNLLTQTVGSTTVQVCRNNDVCSGKTPF